MALLAVLCKPLLAPGESEKFQAVTDGDFYGTPFAGGASKVGTVFKVTTNGVLTTLVSFNGTNGENPQAELMLSKDGYSYGPTWRGGSSGHGTVFRVTTNGALRSLASFTGGIGSHPTPDLVLALDGYFSGTRRWPLELISRLDRFPSLRFICRFNLLPGSGGQETKGLCPKR